jgi:hypothetical protein
MDSVDEDLKKKNYSVEASLSPFFFLIPISMFCLPGLFPSLLEHYNSLLNSSLYFLLTQVIKMFLFIQRILSHYILHCSVCFLL